MTYTEKVLKEFREKFVSYGESTTRVNPNALKELESFLTTALENQRKQIVEIWKPIKGYEGRYSISDRGRVMSHKYNGGNTERIMIPTTLPDGYPKLFLVGDDGIRSRVKIHKLVAEAFIGKKPDGLEINHIDGIKYNNDSENLEYVTSKENSQHAYRTGAWKPAVGEKCVLAKLKDAQVVEIRKLHKEGESACSISRKYGVSPTTIKDIVKWKTWKHLPTIS